MHISYIFSSGHRMSVGLRDQYERNRFHDLQGNFKYGERCHESQAIGENLNLTKLYEIRTFGDKADSSHDNKLIPSARSDQKFQCSVCTVIFTSELALEAHVKACHKYFCEVCHKKFTSSSGYYMHNRIHHGNDDTVQICKICGKRFGSASRLKRHLSSHSTDRPYQCVYCKKAYKHKDTLENHVCN